jgi:hypothetical protein
MCHTAGNERVSFVRRVPQTEHYRCIDIPVGSRFPHFPMEAPIQLGARFFVALRKDGHVGNGSPVYHAVTPYTRPALCGTEPGTRSRWAEPPATAVTCLTCLRRLERLRKVS